MGEHGKRAAPKAAARKGSAAGAGAPHGGHTRAATVSHDRTRRWGPLTAETAIVLGVAGAIVAGAFMVEAIQPSSQRTNTSVGPETIVEHQLGQGGIKPGALQPRTIVRPTAKPVTPTALPTTTAKPTKTPKPAKTTEPTNEPGGGAITDPGTGGGSTCTPIPLIRTCPDEPVKTPDPEPADPEPEDPPADTDPAPDPEATEASTQNATAKNKKKPIPPPTEESESAASP